MKDVARFFRVLGDESRLQMLWLLFNSDELCVCDFINVLGITQSKASRHLAALRNAGLVDDRREAVWSYHSLALPVSDFEKRQMDALKEAMAKRNDAVALLENLKVWLKGKERV